MMKNSQVKLTSEGLAKLKKELSELKEEKQPALIKRVARARDFGDLSENSEYANAREELGFVEQRVAELELVVKNASVIKKTNGNSVIKLGNQVTVASGGNQRTYTLVGELEADPMAQKISMSSPIGKALLGKKKGDKVKVETPGGEVEYLIKKIN